MARPLSPAARRKAEKRARQEAFAAALKGCPHDGHWEPTPDGRGVIRCSCWQRALLAREQPVDVALPLGGRERVR